MQSVNFALLNFDNIEKSKDTFDETMVEPLLSLFKDKYELDACFIALVIEDTYELVIGKNSCSEEGKHFVQIYNMGKDGYDKLFKNYDENLLCDHANSILNGESILHYGVFRDDGTLDGIVGFADFHNRKRVWTKDEKSSLVKLGRTLRLAVLYEKIKVQSKEQISRLRNEFKDQINIITSATSDYSSIFLIDYNTLVQTLYYSNEKYKTVLDLVAKELYYPKSTVLAIYAMVYKDDRKRILEATEINNVKSRLAADGIYTVNFRRYCDDVLDYAAFRYTLIELENKKYIVLSVKEVSALASDNKKESNYDELTGLFEKDEFLRRCEEKITLSKDLTNYYMIAFDVDNITQYNAYFGMEIGNVLLKHIASILKTLTEKVDTIYARLGADRFVMFINEPLSVVEELISNIKSNVRLFNPKFYVNLSFGISKIENKHIPIAAMIDRALAAIGGVKYRYDKKFNFYDDTIIEHRKMDKYFVDNMEEALKNHKIIPYYQPIYDLNNNICVLEELARWQDNGKLVEFSKFKEVFEITKYVFKMDALIWEDSIKFLKNRIDNKKKVYPISLNISDLYLTYNELPETLNKLIKRYGIKPELIYVEINGCKLIDEYCECIDVIKSLNSIGVRIVLDNFKSSINLLNDGLFYALKINITNFDLKNKNNVIILKSIYDLANSLNIKVIATKVETKEEYDTLANIGINYIQGYYLSDALSEKEIDEK